MGEQIAHVKRKKSLRAIRMGNSIGTGQRSRNMAEEKRETAIA